MPVFGGSARKVSSPWPFAFFCFSGSPRDGKREVFSPKHGDFAETPPPPLPGTENPAKMKENAAVDTDPVQYAVSAGPHEKETADASKHRNLEVPEASEVPETSEIPEASECPAA